MLTRGDVIRTFGKWRSAGLRVPVDEAWRAEQMIQDFLRTYSFLNSEQLEILSDRLSHSPMWPTYFVVNQAIKELELEEAKEGEEDGFSRLGKLAYKKNEELQAFADRVGIKYFPQQSESWRQEHALSLEWYGLVACACRTCKGSCPFYGHQMHLRLDSEGRPHRVASAKLCDKYLRKEGSQS